MDVGSRRFFRAPDMASPSRRAVAMPPLKVLPSCGCARPPDRVVWSLPSSFVDVRSRSDELGEDPIEKTGVKQF